MRHAKLSLYSLKVRHEVAIPLKPSDFRCYKRGHEADNGDQGEGPAQAGCMGDETDDRGADQESQEADAGYGGNGDTGDHGFGFARKAVAHRDDGGCAEADECEAQRGDDDVRVQDGEQKAGGDGDAADLEDGDDSKTDDEAVCSEASQGHGAHEGDVAEANEIGPRVDDAFKVHSTPVEHGAFRCHAAESDEAEEEDIFVRLGEDFFFARGGGCLPGMGIARQHEGTHNEQGDEAEGKDDAEVLQRVEVLADHPCADESADESCQAPEPVEAGHDAASVEAFDSHSLRVDGDVAEVGCHSEEEEGGGELGDVSREAEEDEGSGVEDGGEGDHSPAPVFTDGIAGEGHGNHLPQGDDEEEATEGGIVELECLLDIRDAACPTGKDEALYEVEGAGGKTVVPGSGGRQWIIHGLGVGTLRLSAVWLKSKVEAYVMS